MNLVSMLVEVSKRTPDAIAVIDDFGRTLTFSQWLRRAQRVAGALESSVSSGVPVLLAFRTAEVIDFAAAYIGVLGVGAVAVPVCLPTPPAEIARIAETVNASYVLSTQDTDASPGHRSVLPMLTYGRPIDLLESFASDQPAQILHSSGTTGLPTAIVVPHGNLAWVGDARPTQRTRRLLIHAFPLGTSAFQSQFVRTITHDYTIRVLRLFNPKKLVWILRDADVSTVLLAPAMVTILADVVDPQDNFPSVESVGTTGSFLQPRQYEILKRVFPQAEIITSYGSTEASPAGTSRLFDPDQPLNVGLPLKGCAVRTTDELGRPVAAGVLGVVWLSVQGAPTRHYLDAELNRRYFDGDWIRTGDIGYIEGDGSLVIVGRATDVISVGGLKVSGPEVEAVMSRHPAVREVAVFGRPHDLLGEQVVAQIVTRYGVEERELLAFARANLTRYKVPSHISFVDHLERNAMGKVPARRRQEP